MPINLGAPSSNISRRFNILQEEQKETITPHSEKSIKGIMKTN